MGYPVKFKGPQIDEALAKAESLRIVNNGWIRLESTSAAPINLSTLKNPGNYTISHWSDGPAIEGDKYSHINVVVTSINGALHQFVDLGGIIYSRNTNVGEIIYGDWLIDQTTGSINLGPNSPANPADGKTIWLDSEDPTNPVLKIYINGKWVEIIPSDAMLASTYDPNNKKTDIFKYIDDAIKEANLETLSENIDDHINDDTIHATATEKIAWNNAASQTYVDGKIATLKTELTNIIEEDLGELPGLEELKTDLSNLETDVDNHVKNSAIHPTAEQQNDWNNKAEGDHVHELDDSVVITPDNIEGPIPTELVPSDVKERAYIVESDEARLALTKDPIHNGDSICVDSNGQLAWYFVIDDSKLGTEDAATAFKPIGNLSEFSWGNIQNKPTTLAGYGITDAATAEDVNNINTKLEEVSETLSELNIEDVTDTQTTFNNILENLQTVDETMSAMEATLNLMESIAN